MARIRTFKPEFWRHPVISRLPDAVQLMALAVLSMADDEGYFHADPSIVRGEVMPFREDLARISEYLASLSRVGWIDLWTHPEQGQMGVVVNWAKHQKIDHPSRSKLKVYDIRESLASVSRLTSETLALEQGSRNRDQGTGKQPVAKAPKIDPKSDPRFVRFWGDYDKKTGKAETMAAWAKLTEDEKNQAVEAASPYSRLHNDPKFRKDPVRFIKGRLWEDEAVAGEQPPVRTQAEIDASHAFIDSLEA